MRCLLLWSVLGLTFLGQTWAGNLQNFTTLRKAAGQYLLGEAAANYPDSHAEVDIGPIDPRLSLPHCPEPLFSLASGSKLYGPGNLEVLCRHPSAWSLFLTYQIALRGPALLASRPLAAGSVPGPDDVTSETITYTSDPGRYPQDVGKLRGAALTRPVARQSPITVDILRIQPIIKSGQRVRIRVEGVGFQVSQTGIAQGQAAIGDSLRLKTPSGRFVQGIVQTDGSVVINP